MGAPARPASAAVSAAAAAALLLCCATLLHPAAALPSREDILKDGMRAAQYWSNTSSGKRPCDWKYSTLMLGIMQLQRATGDAALRTWAMEFAEANKWQLCPEGAGAFVADNQLCGSTYLELYSSVPQAERNATWLAGIRRQFDGEIEKGEITNWNWLDALFMSMSTWSRLGALTGETKYFDHMWKNFEFAVSPAGYAFYSAADNLFYRDPPRGAPDSIFWSRGNGWAMGALVAAAEHSPAFDPRGAVYEDFLVRHAARLRELQGADGCWRVSLTDPAFNDAPETTGTAMFVYGVAWGVKEGVLDAETYMPVLEAGWRCLSKTALQRSGRVGYCQPMGTGPRRNFGPDSTNIFCVGQFLMAATQLSKLAAGSP